MSEYVQIVAGDVTNIISQINAQKQRAEDQVDRVRSGLGVTITPGIWEGDGAEAFAQYVLTQYIPEAMALIASIGGISIGFSYGLDLWQKCDDTAFGQVGDLVSSFNFF
jgi:hypothetical protein